MIPERKRECWEALSTESGVKSPEEIMRWAKDPWRLKERMSHLWGAAGRWLESEDNKVGGLVRDLFGAGMGDMWDRRTAMHVVSPYDEETVM